MVRLTRRFVALALTFGLLAGNAAVCAGWMATPEARMACCADGDCPMHHGDSHGSESVTQALADGCCAMSDGQNSNPSNPPLVTVITGAVLGAGVVLPATVPALVASRAHRLAAPTPVAPVPKHVLLCTFLV